MNTSRNMREKCHKRADLLHAQWVQLIREFVMVQDTDIESPEAAALAAQAADILSCAHAAAVEEANNQFCDDHDLGQHPIAILQIT